MNHTCSLFVSCSRVDDLKIWIFYWRIDNLPDLSHRLLSIFIFYFLNVCDENCFIMNDLHLWLKKQIVKKNCKRRVCNYFLCWNRLFYYSFLSIIDRPKVVKLFSNTNFYTCNGVKFELKKKSNVLQCENPVKLQCLPPFMSSRRHPLGGDFF